MTKRKLRRTGAMNLSGATFYYTRKRKKKKKRKSCRPKNCLSISDLCHTKAEGATARRIKKYIYCANKIASHPRYHFFKFHSDMIRPYRASCP